MTAGPGALRPSGVNSGALDGKRLEYLRALHEHSNGTGIGYTTWMKASLAKSGAAFDDARKWLLDMQLVRCELRKYTATEAGRLALANAVTPVHSNGAPTLYGAGSNHSTPKPRVYVHGVGGVDGIEGGE